MAYTGQISRRQRAIAAGAAGVTVALIGVGLATGFDVAVVRSATETIEALSLPAPKPPDTATPSTRKSDKAAGAASQANRTAKATAIVAHKPKLRPPVVPPITAAPKAGEGAQASAGAAPAEGPGTGAGGSGNGFGAGGAGNGTGGGTKAEWRSGTIRDSDYPREARRAKIGGDVEVRFTIEADGGVSGCRVTRSSGDASLDATTCRLIETRFRFRPATNGAGQPIASSYGWRQTWWLERGN